MIRLINYKANTAMNLASALSVPFSLSPIYTFRRVPVKTVACMLCHSTLIQDRNKLELLCSSFKECMQHVLHKPCI